TMRKSLLATGSVAILGLGLGLAGCSSTAEEPDSITISLVPSVQGEDLAEALDPLTEYLSEGLGMEVEGVVADNYNATVEALGADPSEGHISDAGQPLNQSKQS